VWLLCLVLFTAAALGNLALRPSVLRRRAENTVLAVA
jgi:hypothetical protein